MDVVPVVMGDGVRFFGCHTGTVLLDDPDQVVHGDRVPHLHFTIKHDRPIGRLSGQQSTRQTSSLRLSFELAVSGEFEHSPPSTLCYVARTLSDHRLSCSALRT